MASWQVRLSTSARLPEPHIRGHGLEQECGSGFPRRVFGASVGRMSASQEGQTLLRSSRTGVTSRTGNPHITDPMYIGVVLRRRTRRYDVLALD